MSEILTVLKAVELSAEYLKKKGIDEARPNAELLLADILNCKRLDLYLQFDRPLNEKEKSIYREYLSRRANGEPLQYITGEVEFYGLKLKVNPSVLIPRPETELLVEKIIEENKGKGELKILDIGTGSGNIAIALKVNLPGANIFSIDISEEALETARGNAELNGLQDGITFETADIFDENVITKFQDFDIIVSNPPYVSEKEMENIQREIKDYEPKEAVTDGTDGLKFFKRISSVAKMILKKGGKIYFEIGEGESEKVSEILSKEGFKNIEIEKDFSGIPRIVKGEL
jgi:release factor glutamine methyltransferase